MKKDVAAAFFVRTIGFSEAKTRLANRVGKEVTEEIYKISIERCKELADGMAADGVQVIWAVAEPEAVNADCWTSTGHESILSGEGDLGDCIANVYGQLRKRAHTAMLLGSDSPQLMLADLKAAWEKQQESQVVVGPATDGGFYLLSGSTDIPARIWKSVEYSVPTTLNQLEIAIGRPSRRLSKLTDFDDLASLLQVLKEMPSEMSPAQRKFAALANMTLEEQRHN